MSKVYVYLADGFEDIEALTPVDFLRRAGIEVRTVSINSTLEVTSAHGVTVKADQLVTDTDTADADLLVAPGGMPGAANLAACQAVCDAFSAQAITGRLVAAICAAPAVLLASIGILNGRSATCYPGFESALEAAGATHVAERVVTDGNIITANGPSSAIPFALTLIAALSGEQKAAEVAAGILL